jgi:hypothetical protein
MRYGFEVRDGAGNLTIASDTFTARLVDRFVINSGPASGQDVPRAKVKPGMFCAFQYPVQSFGLGRPALPLGIVIDGAVQVRPLLSGTAISYPYECLVMAYV